jgi:hypothetical protein
MQAGAISDAADKARADVAPFRQAGVNALGVVSDLSGANGPDAATKALANYQTSPGYQFQLGQGLRAIDAGAASTGILRSGATIKAEQAFGQGLADSDFGTYYNRLMDLTKVGASAATGTAQTDASAGTATAGIIGNTAAGISNAANNYANQSVYGNRFNSLLSAIGGSGGGGGNFLDQVAGSIGGGSVSV